MNTDLILSNVAKHITLNDHEKKFFLSLLLPQTLKRKTLFLQQGEVCKNSAFVIDGALRSFSVDKEGKEHILNFATQGWWMSDLYSLISKKPSTLNIEAIDDTDVFILSGTDQQLLYEKVPKFERFFRILIENALVANQQRLIDNLSLPAEERYLQFLKKYPIIPSCVPQHNIASYLGITPEFLSKIRARLAKK
ncbi:Crp/Fnr family transcriptional regulator [Chryseolinea sp. H1M3-3]|uniref:Crp/Fnr family transcriptional regulator n=1 Tax=Chryseolinea sp. H1M3-3 TaxID=3034144 RepID=UPI0023EBAEFC|nr:Crp/Fnr family transcriptional regulator [Chryseolinea sp. H1M3-3]